VERKILPAEIFAVQLNLSISVVVLPALYDLKQCDLKRVYQPAASAAPHQWTIHRAKGLVGCGGFYNDTTVNIQQEKLELL